MGLCNDQFFGPSTVAADDELIPSPERIADGMDYPELTDFAAQLFALAESHRGSHDDWRIVDLVLRTYQKRMEAV